METSNQTTSMQNETAAASKPPESILAELEGKLHHLELLPTATAQWFKDKFNELKVALTGKPVDAEPLLADAGASTAAAATENSRESTSESDAANVPDPNFVQAQTIGTINDGVNTGLKDAGFEGSTVVTTDDEGYIVEFTRAADGVKADVRPFLFKDDVADASDFVAQSVAHLVEWLKQYDDHKSAGNNAQ